MTKIYVVTSGCYSDYCINALFSSKKLAETFIAKAAEVAAKNASNLDTEEDGLYIGGFSASDCNIEEWILDEEQTVTIHKRWWVRILLASGVVVGEVCESLQNARKHGGSAIVIESVPILGGKSVIDAESCRSARHAIKLAVEARQAQLRKQTEMIEG